MNHRLPEVPATAEIAPHYRHLHLVGPPGGPAQTRINSAIRINLLDSTISAGAGVIPLTGRDLELICCIALRERPVSRATLISNIWPDVDEDDAANSFHVCLHRLRKRLGGRKAISLTPHGYGLGAHISTDFQALEAFDKSLRGRASVSDQEIELITAAHHRLVLASVPASIARTVAGEILADRIEFLKHGLAKQLAVVALKFDRTTNALEIAHDMVRLDACDESAWEIIIRVHLANHDHGSALRDFRKYSQNLAHELGLAPSWTIKRLVIDCDNAPRSLGR